MKTFKLPSKPFRLRKKQYKATFFVICMTVLLVHLWTTQYGVHIYIRRKTYNNDKFPNEGFEKKDSSMSLSFINVKKREEPKQCRIWRDVAWKPSKLRLYKEHFNSHDVSDWFLYTSIFNEQWHLAAKERPVYIDIAANHARRWSTTWFFDRCMSWDGLCVEPNPTYWTELKTERSCKLFPRCISDERRWVNFSFAAAYGGVTIDSSHLGILQNMGVNGSRHMTEKKFEKVFSEITEIQCVTIGDALKSFGGERTHINLMSLDVEGHEYPILKGLNWEKYLIDVIIIESRRPQVIRLLKSQDFQRYTNIHKDDIWIRRGSGLSLDSLAIAQLRSLNLTSYRFI